MGSFQTLKASERNIVDEVVARKASIARNRPRASTACSGCKRPVTPPVTAPSCARKSSAQSSSELVF